MNLQMPALAFLAATAVGGLAWVFIYPMLSGEKQAEARRLSIAKPDSLFQAGGKLVGGSVPNFWETFSFPHLHAIFS